MDNKLWNELKRPCDMGNMINLFDMVHITWTILYDHMVKSILNYHMIWSISLLYQIVTQVPGV